MFKLRNLIIIKCIAKYDERLKGIYYPDFDNIKNVLELYTERNSFISYDTIDKMYLYSECFLDALSSNNKLYVIRNKRIAFGYKGKYNKRMHLLRYDYDKYINCWEFNGIQLSKKINYEILYKKKIEIDYEKIEEKIKEKINEN